MKRSVPADAKSSEAARHVIIYQCLQKMRGLMRILIIQSSTQRHDPNLQQSHKARKFYFDYDRWFYSNRVTPQSAKNRI